VPDAELPRFPRAPRWDRDPDFDARVSRLRGLRDDAAQRLDLDPGVLLSRERLEAVARRNPATLDELAAMPELRRWQVAELGESLLAALREVERSAAAADGGAAASAPPRPRLPSAPRAARPRRLLRRRRPRSCPRRPRRPSTPRATTRTIAPPYRDG
jgi:ribonuclease D